MLKVVAITLCLAAMLWFGIRSFVGGTEALSRGLDVRAVDRAGSEAMAAGREAERPAPGQGPAVEALDAAGHDAGAPGREGADAAPVAAGEGGAPERPDSDDDTVERGGGEASGAAGPGARVEIEGRDAELERLLVELDRDLLRDAPPTRALDVGLAAAALAACPAAADARGRTGVLFRHGSAAIRGRSLNRIDELLSLRRACGGGELRVAPNPEGEVDDAPGLAERRRDEIKYYLLQRRVPAADIVFDERS